MSAPEHNPYFVDISYGPTAEEVDSVKFGAITETQGKIYKKVNKHHKLRGYLADGSDGSQKMLHFTSYDWKTVWINTPPYGWIPHMQENRTNYYIANNGKNWFLSTSPFRDNNNPYRYNHVYQVEKVDAWAVVETSRIYPDDQNNATNKKWVSLNFTISKEFYDRNDPTPNMPAPIRTNIPYAQFKELRRYWDRNDNRNKKTMFEVHFKE